MSWGEAAEGKALMETGTTGARKHLCPTQGPVAPQSPPGSQAAGPWPPQALAAPRQQHGRSGEGPCLDRRGEGACLHHPPRTWSCLFWFSPMDERSRTGLVTVGLQGRAAARTPLQAGNILIDAVGERSGSRAGGR